MKVARFGEALGRTSRALCSTPSISRVPAVTQLALRPARRLASTDSQAQEPIVAAPPIADLENIRISARIVPSSASYFTGKPRSTDELLYLQYLVRKNETLPVVKPGQAPRIAFQTLVDYRNTIGETVKSSKYKKTLELLHRLNHIHPDLKSDEVKAVLEKHKRAIDPFANVAKPITVDKFGRAVGTGRRKTSTARAWLVEGTGEVMVNGKSLVDAFARVHDRESAIWALKATERLDKYNVWALAEGGGTTGQAEAMTLAVAKALMAHEPLLKSALRRAGCIRRDPRVVERKKPGHVKARKMPAWVKR